MGEKGPCDHCGTESTPLWRKGPDHKPILCNACGTKWRVRGRLDNYIPKHGFVEGYGIEVTRQGKTPYPVHRSKVQKLANTLEREKSGGSTISFSNKYTKLESETSKEDSGLSHQSFWGSDIPRRKRSEVDESDLDPIRLLQRQLKDLLQKPEFEHLREESEMLISPNNQISYDEIGLGCIFLNSPDSTN